MSTPLPKKTKEVYLVLREYAAKNECVAYSVIANEVGLANRGVSLPLYYIWGFCQGLEIPHLSAIAVNKNTGLPGPGYPVDEQELKDIQRGVFAYPWPEDLLSLLSGRGRGLGFSPGVTRG